MDKQTLALFIPIVALMIPVAAIVMGGLIKLAKLRAGRDERLPSEVEARLQAMEEELHVLRQELSEANERLDFTERLLAKPDQGRLARGKE